MLEIRLAGIPAKKLVANGAASPGQLVDLGPKQSNKMA
jgi:hypothetical protein